MLLTRIFKRIYNYIRQKHIRDYAVIKDFFDSSCERCGLEIGGPSAVFQSWGRIPIYRKTKNIDGVNFSDTTSWTGSINKDRGYIVNGKRYGSLYISDATDLSDIAENRYDFILSSNNLEHITNPLKALERQLHKLKKGGFFITVVPRKETNFDHQRKIVLFSHLIDDYQNDLSEKDLFHLSEILESHDLKKDPAAGSYDDFIKRSLNNYENRCLHHHVFDLEVLRQIYNYFNLKILSYENLVTDYVIIGEKQ